MRGSPQEVAGGHRHEVQPWCKSMERTTEQYSLVLEIKWPLKNLLNKSGFKRKESEIE